MRQIPQGLFYELWYQDLDKIIDEVYGIEGYRCLDEIYDNYVNGMYDVWNTEDGIEFDWEDELTDWLEDPTPSGMHPRPIMWAMARDGHIPAGKYLIHIWW